MLAQESAHEAESISVLVPSDTRLETFQMSTVDRSETGWARVDVPVDGTVEETLARLEADLGSEVFVERSYPLLAGSDEPWFEDQWGLRNTGQTGGTSDADIDIERAWASATGSGVVVAVIDSGVNGDHPDLIGQLWVNKGETVNGKDDDNNGYIDDIDGWDFEGFGVGDNDPSPDGIGSGDSHGTLIAGIVAAGVNGIGISGVAPDSRVMNVRACDDGSCLTLDAIEAIHYAVDNGADILNLSFGGVSSSLDDDEPLFDAFDYARENDVLIVTAGGNTPPDQVGPGNFIIPAEFPHSNNVAVAASDHRDRMAAFTYYGANIDIAAPGQEILSTSVDGYELVSGTSFAAPFVAGAAALLLSDDPSVGHRELAARLRAWSDNPGGISGRVQSGRLNAGDLVRYRFTDTVRATFEADVDWAAETGVTQGCNPPENTRFCPDDPVTREQMAAFLKRHLRLPAASKDYFSDDEGSTFEAEINAMAEAGITRGCNPPSNNRFCPDDEVTRQQMAAFLVRALGLTADHLGGFSDVPTQNIFQGDIDRLATAGITKGCNPPANTRFCPDDEVTRGQMTAFLHRADG